MQLYILSLSKFNLHFAFSIIFIGPRFLLFVCNTRLIIFEDSYTDIFHPVTLRNLMNSRGDLYTCTLLSLPSKVSPHIIQLWMKIFPFYSITNN